MLLILKKFFLNPLYDCWKSVKSTLPATPLKLTTISSRVVNFEEEKKGVYKRRKAEAVAEDGESPYECPTVGM